MQPYEQLLEAFQESVEPTFVPLLQLLFIIYLLLGMGLLLGLWWFLIPRQFSAARWGKIGFALTLLLSQIGLLFLWPVLWNAWLRADPIARADVIVTLHLALVLGVLVTLLLVLLGGVLGWSWVRHFWFRVIQLLLIQIIAGQAVVGLECPLKTLERHLRGGPGYLHELDNAHPIGRFCNELLYYELPQQIFLVIYLVVALLMLSTWIFVPPRLPWQPAEPLP